MLVAPENGVDGVQDMQNPKSAFQVSCCKGSAEGSQKEKYIENKCVTLQESIQKNYC